MAAPFFEALANQISDSFGLGENTNKSLDIVQNGHTKRYAQLGAFANKFDQSSERRYLEEGYLRKDTFNVEPKQFQILMQEPELTVLVKKKMFSSVAENFRPDLMDEQDKLFYRTSRILFQNKCKQIAAYEKLSKIERVSATVGEFDTAMMPIVMSLFDELSSTSFSSAGLFSPLEAKVSKMSDVIQKIRKVYAFSPPRNYTSWLKYDSTLFANQLGEGTGVIELTNVTSINTNTTVDGAAGGSCSITISDPYQLMLITESDLERALSDATNPMFNHLIFRLGKESADDSIARNTTLLNDKRRARGASDINFRINPDTLLGDKVVAIVDKLGEKINFTYDAALGLGGLGIGKGVQVSDDSKINGELLGQEGLNTKSDRTTLPGTENVRALVQTSELSLFEEIITSVFNKIQLETNARANINQKSEKVNYARRKLRFYFLGKRIIQPMDQINIYIGSKSMFDNKILSGLQQSFNAYGFLKNLDKTAFDLKNSISTLFNPSGNIDMQLEKSVLVGENFPNFLWGMMRNQFVNERSGSHVFGGIVTAARGSYSEGRYSVNISGKDNTAYFEQGWVNFKPSADVFDGALYDPLTPFKTSFDTVSSNFKNEAPKLLDENEKLLGTKLVRYKLGPHAGRIATSGSLLHDKDIDNKGKRRDVLYAPDGLVYRWKEGIGTLIQYGDSFHANDPNRLGAQAINKDPFAGQDIMNVLSLLISGEPYNYANYYKGMRDSGNLLRDPQSKQDPAFSFYASLRNDLTKRNMNWGNFVPFKTQSVTDETFAKALNGQLSIINKNDEIENKLKDLSDISNKLRDLDLLVGATDLDAGAVKAALTDKRININLEINQMNDKIFESLTDSNNLSSAFSLVGNDVSFDSDEILNTGKINKSLSDGGTKRRALRRKTNFLTRRMSWKVRANEDANLFIVDDYYDKDYDILAFEKSFSDGFSTFKSQYTTVKDQIFQVSQMLNLETFCDTQGHIRVRPAQYNKMPSSIFYKMLQLKSEKGIQVFPQFLENLFVNQIDGIIHRLEIIENQIRFDAAIMGKNTDLEVEAFVNSGGKITPNAEGHFEFLSAGDTWTIIDARTLIAVSNPESKTDVFSNKIIRGQVFGPAQRSQIIQDIFQAPLDAKSPITSFTSSDRLNTLRSRLTMDGQTIALDNFLQKTETGIIAPIINKVPDIFKIIKDIADKIAERQKLLKIATNLLKNLKEAKSLANGNKTANTLLFPNLGKNSFVPEIFEAMIEDEEYDDLGINSGKRFIIKNSMIKSMEDSENPPEYTMIQVNGMLDPNGVAVGIPAELNSFAQNGNGLISAAAVDYDTWRMYGMKVSSPVNAIFLHDPETQCAPYAAALLSRARKQILQADIVLAGNEYMQPGEVVYVEERGLLYYVQSVSHQFTYGGSFNTSIKLIYGHSPGEYIPTPFDVVGKMLYINRDNTEIINQKQQSAFNENSLGVIVYDPKSSGIDDPQKTLFEGNSGSHNEKIIASILGTTAFTLKSNSAKGVNKRAKIDVRIYYSDNSPINSNLSNAADAVVKVLNGAINPKTGDVLNGNIQTVSLDEDLIKVDPVNLSNPEGQKSASSKAWDTARNLSKNNSLFKVGETKTDDSVSKALFKYVIDCWITFENISPDDPGVPS